MQIQGIQIQSISLLRISKPRPLIKALRLNGDTSIGVTGKKYRSVIKGERRAMPNPPLVKASRIPWREIIKEKNKAKNNPSLHFLFPVTINRAPTKKPRIQAKNNEWKNPLCPRKCE